MTAQLHILTRADDELALEILQHLRAQPDANVVTVDLTQAETDYGKLVEQIFAADAVTVW